MNNNECSQHFSEEQNKRKREDKEEEHAIVEHVAQKPRKDATCEKSAEEAAEGKSMPS